MPDSRTTRDGTPVHDAPLAVDGGAPLLASGYPSVPSVHPAGDAYPIRALERELAARLDLAPAHVVALGSAASAYRALIKAGLGETGRQGPEAEVIVPDLLGESAATAACAVDATAIPGEVDASNGTLTAAGVARAVSPRTAVIVAAHAFGHPAAVDEIARVIDGHGIAIVEDASDALGAGLRGVPAGRMAEAAVFAFRRGRLLTSGEVNDGALLVVRDEGTAHRVRDQVNEQDAILDETSARIALAALRGMDEELAARRELAWELTFDLRGAKALVPMPHGRWIRHGYSSYVIRLRSMLWQRTIDDTVTAIRAEGVPCDRACGPPLHLDTTLSRGDDDRVESARFPAATRLAEELIAIPLHAGLTARDMVSVASVLRHVERWSL